MNCLTYKKIFILLIIALLCLPPQAWPVEDAILAVVNSEVITLKDLREYFSTTYMSLTAQGFSEEKINDIMQDLEKNGLAKLIEDKLILSHANEVGMEVNEKVIKQKIEEIKGNYPSDEIFMESLLAHGGTMSDMRKKIEDQYKIKFIIEHEIRSKIYVSPQEVTEFYKKHIDEFQMKERIVLESIFVSYGSNKIAAKQRAKEALDLIKQGEDFMEVSKKYSDAPSIGTVERGQLLPSIEKVVFHLQKDVPSDIVELETGYYIFKMTGRAPAQIASLQDVKDDIRDRLFRTKFRERFVEWVEELKEDAYIDIKE